MKYKQLPARFEHVIDSIFYGDNRYTKYIEIQSMFILLDLTYFNIQFFNSFVKKSFIGLVYMKLES